MCGQNNTKGRKYNFSLKREPFQNELQISVYFKINGDHNHILKKKMEYDNSLKSQRIPRKNIIFDQYIHKSISSQCETILPSILMKEDICEVENLNSLNISFDTNKEELLNFYNSQNIKIEEFQTNINIQEFQTNSSIQKFEINNLDQKFKLNNTDKKNTIKSISITSHDGINKHTFKEKVICLDKFDYIKYLIKVGKNTFHMNQVSIDKLNNNGWLAAELIEAFLNVTLNAKNVYIFAVPTISKIILGRKTQLLKEELVKCKIFIGVIYREDIFHFTCFHAKFSNLTGIFTYIDPFGNSNLSMQADFDRAFINWK